MSSQPPPALCACILISGMVSNGCDSLKLHCAPLGFQQPYYAHQVLSPKPSLVINTDWRSHIPASFYDLDLHAFLMEEIID